MPEKKKKRTKPVIGRVELIDFIDFSLDNIEAKIDSGAFSSSLHCDEIREENGTLHLRFDRLSEAGTSNDLVFKNYTQAKVKSSNGETQNRFKVVLTIRIGNEVIETDFTLADRGEMKYPVLLGRKAIKKLFLIDVSKTFLLSK